MILCCCQLSAVRIQCIAVSCDRAVCRVPGLGQGDEQGCVAHRGGAHALRQDEEEGRHYKYSRRHVYCHVYY